MSLKDRFSNAWNAFQTERTREVDLRNSDRSLFQAVESPSYFNHDRTRMRYNSEHSILNSIFNRIANDVASTAILHVRVDENDRYIETIKSGLNDCMTLSANLDQTSRAFWMDLVLSMLDEGVVGATPIDTSVDIVNNNSFDILSIRVGKILEWMPSFVKMEVYNERTGKREALILPKDKVAILENPFYSIMNEPNSTLKRLVSKMNLLDKIDGQKATSKLNLLVQLPYSLKSPSRIAQAEDRRRVLESQLEDSKYGVAYIDSTEHVTQLNRAIENDLPQQIQTLTDQLYNQIGISSDVFKGTANKEQMQIYNKKVLKPILDLIQLEFTRKFLTPTARTQGQKIAYFIDAFDLVTPDEVGEMANAFSRNEILSSNEFRSILGFKPDANPRSDQLVNKNINPIKPIEGAISESGNAEDSESIIEGLDHIDVSKLTLNEAQEYLRELDDIESDIDEMMSNARKA